MSTQHYERRDEGFFIVWGKDFSNETPGERRLYDGGDLRHLSGLDEEVQREYMDLRERASTNKAQVSEMGHCKKCDKYIPPVTVTKEVHLCAGFLR